MAHELCGEYVGPMPVDQLLETFVPDRTGGAEPPVDLEDWDQHNTFFASRYRYRQTDSQPVLEKHLYEPIKTCIQRFLTNFTVVVTAHRTDELSGPEEKWRPDVSVYSSTLSNTAAFGKDLTQLNNAEVVIEIKRSPFKVFGTDDDAPFFSKGKDAKEVRRRIATLLAEQMNRQWRTFAFFILITDPYVYLIRADRAGLIVSAPIDFRTEPKNFLKFLWRYNFLSAEERGMDLTVRLATSEEAELAKEELSPHLPEREHVPPVFVVEVPDRTTPRHVFVWDSLYDVESLTGCCTRAFPAWDPEARKVQFLKDTWRSNKESREKESDVLRELNGANVEHVPTLVAGEDVPGMYHHTVTQVYTQPTPHWVKSKPEELDKRTHHRLLENFVPTPLEDFGTPREFLQALFDGFIAHKGAYALGFLHRDVSDNNIMIDETGRGVLVDWGLAIRVKDANGALIPGKVGQRYRTGTWAFMSCNLLREISCQKPHALADDQQSFLWIGLYYIIQSFNPIIADNPGVEVLIDQYFNSNTYNPNQNDYTGGAEKSMVIVGQSNLCHLEIPNNKPMEKWYKNVLKVFHDVEVAQIFLDPLRLPPDLPDLSRHDALEQIFRESLDADGWSFRREPTEGQAEGEGI
ncbi:hypothetical protein MD484_g5701, partial [Candolleomyces efflorescens]